MSRRRTWLRSGRVGRGALVGAMALLASGLTGCENRQERLRRIASAAATSGRATTLQSLRATNESGHDWLGDAVLEAADRYRRKDPGWLEFASAVLDLSREHEDKLGGQALLLRQSVALLAFCSADEAWRVRGDAPLGADLVLAFPRALQTDAYWMSNPEHDALASLILFDAGKQMEAIERLEIRAGASEVGANVLAELKRRKDRPQSVEPKVERR